MSKSIPFPEAQKLFDQIEEILKPLKVGESRMAVAVRLFNSASSENKLERRLESLTKILATKDICVALTILDDKILISNNRGDKTIIEKFKDTIVPLISAREIAPISKALKEFLVDNSTRDQIKVFSVGTLSYKTLNNHLRSSPKVKPLLEYLAKLENKFDSNVYLELLENAYQLKNEVDDDRVSNIISDIAAPMTAVMKLAEFFAGGTKVGAEKAERYKQVLDIIKEGGIEFIEAKVFVSKQVSGSKKVIKITPHAEMNIADFLYLHPKESVYLAISKLCCNTCKIALDFLNRIKSDGFVETRGCHAKVYDNWCPPNFLLYSSPETQEDFIKELQKLKATFESGKDAPPHSESDPEGGEGSARIYEGVACAGAGGGCSTYDHEYPPMGS